MTDFPYFVALQDHKWDVQQGNDWNYPEDQYVDSQDAGWCQGNCKTFYATGHPGNYFVTFKYEIDDSDCGMFTERP